MGRKKEFVATKSFTIGLQELVYLEKVCNEKDMKASKFINGLLRKAMLTALEKEKQQHGPITYCTGCNDYKEFEYTEDNDGYNWSCTVCGDDKTKVIDYMLETKGK
tara:strand:+ start:321 stop:638 length:318 start_codon:yes stop_codon:yes gene_type:complete